MALTAFPQFALVLGLVCLALALVTFVVVYALRLHSLAQLRKQADFQSVWGDVLETCFWGEAPRQLPALLPVHHVRFIRLWNHYQSVMEGESRGRLNRLAFRLRAERFLSRLVGSRHIPTRLEAITMVGYLRLKQFWPDVVKASFSPNTYVSLTAIQSLMLMDPPKALAQVILPMMIKRKDWPPTRLGIILARAGSDLLSKPLASAIDHAPISHLPRLVGYLELIDREAALPVLLKYLKRSRDDTVIAQCLHVLSLHENPDDAPVFRLFIQHPNWHIRIKAMAGLGKTGQASDADAFIPQLGHAEWWVRYRAAKALTELPTMTDQRLKAMQDTQVIDRYGKDMLNQVLAERDWHVQRMRGEVQPTAREIATQSGMAVPDMLRGTPPPRPKPSATPDNPDKALS